MDGKEGKKREERKEGGKEERWKAEEGREGRMDSEKEGRMEGDNDCSFRKPAIFTFIKDLFSRNA